MLLQNTTTPLCRYRVGKVGGLGQVFGRLLVDSGDSDRECGGEHEIARVVATETNFSNDFDVTVRKTIRQVTTFPD